MPNVGNSHNTDSSNYRYGKFGYAQLRRPAVAEDIPDHPDEEGDECNRGTGGLLAEGGHEPWCASGGVG